MLSLGTAVKVSVPKFSDDLRISGAPLKSFGPNNLNGAPLMNYANHVAFKALVVPFRYL